MYKDLEKKKATKRAYYLAHCQELKSKNKSYWQANKENLSAKAKEYRLANIERIKEKEREYRQAHKEELGVKNREYQKRYYQMNREKRLQKTKEERTRNKRMVDEYKSLHPCILCGENNPILLVFHHRDMEEKENGISVMAASSYPTHKIIEEMKKCEILCFNCHVLVHAQMRNFEENGTQFSLEEMIQTKKERVVIPTQSLL